MGTPPDPEQLRAYVERFSQVLTDTGFPRMPARVFVVLMTAESGRMTAAEIAEALAISPAAVSGAVRYLIQLNLVGRERDPGSRRDRYRVFDEVWREAMVRRDAVLLRWEVALNEGIALLGAESAASARLEETKQFFAYLRREMPGLLDRYYRERDALAAVTAVTAVTAVSAAAATAAQPSQPGRTSPDS